MDDKIREQSRVCEQHIIVHSKHTLDQYMNVSYKYGMNLL